MSFLGFGGSKNSDGGAAAPPISAEQQQIVDQIKSTISQEIATTYASALVNSLSENCFEKCVKSPSGSLDAAEDKCISDCSRWRDSSYESWREAQDVPACAPNGRSGWAGGEGVGAGAWAAEVEGVPRLWRRAVTQRGRGGGCDYPAGAREAHWVQRVHEGGCAREGRVDAVEEAGGDLRQHGWAR
ncbi:hypothetical protein PMKS-004075 [Pichia membranifaciens]|uniref:Tim10-like domain-containing protein n=1 Tax=Pichia membranifaciens TaxID=4926 RepID=A0A1Q2YM61_9ASCO|nr:hypothetical protein PMKS-004075 [Pichia membranifaciens]